MNSQVAMLCFRFDAGRPLYIFFAPVISLSQSAFAFLSYSHSSYLLHFVFFLSPFLLDQLAKIDFKYQIAIEIQIHFWIGDSSIDGSELLNWIQVERQQQQ